MAEISDEMLMACADGMLGPEERAYVEACMKSDPALAHRLAAFERTGLPVYLLYEGILQEPVPAQLTASVDRAAIGRSQSSIRRGDRGTFAGLLRALKNLLPQGGGLAGLAIAASLALALAVVGTWKSGILRPEEPQTADRKPSSAEESRPIAVADLQIGLEVVPSQRLGVLAEPAGATLTPILTFRNKSGQYCRQYVIASPDSGSRAGLACKSGRDQWRVDFEAPLGAGAPAKAGSPPANGEYTTAAGATLVPALEALIDGSIAGDPFGREEELELIRKSWPEPAK